MLLYSVACSDCSQAGCGCYQNGGRLLCFRDFYALRTRSRQLSLNLIVKYSSSYVLSKTIILVQSFKSSYRKQNLTASWTQGIHGIRDLTKMRCVNRENDTYIDRIRDLTAPREADLVKIWARDAGLMTHSYRALSLY